MGPSPAAPGREAGAGRIAYENPLGLSMQMSEREAGTEGAEDLAVDHGLSSTQVVQARQVHGFNDVLPQSSFGWRVVARQTARDPMLWFLLSTSLVFGFLGQRTEALTLLVALVPLLGMDAWLHRRTLVSTSSLASRLAATARTFRDGSWVDLASRELVPGDLVEVGPGAYFPADGLILGGTGLQCDESSLTGEALPAPKSPMAPAVKLRPPPAEQFLGRAGTRLLTGTARLRVTATGTRTRYGELAGIAAQGRQAATPLQHAIGSLVSVLLVAALFLCVGLAAVRAWQGHGLVDSVMSALTLAVAALPEEFPIVYAFFLGLGTFRLAGRKALVRRAVAVENIGRTTCIVADKTGTITEGRLTLAQCVPGEGFDEASLLGIAKSASRRDSGDPLDEALHAGGEFPSYVRQVAAFPFTEASRRETFIWQIDANRAIACVKGAPETVIGTCDLATGDRARWHDLVAQLAAGGHKVIAVAKRELPAADNPSEPATHCQLAGLLAFVDPVRSGVREAIGACVAAGIRVLMVTGDHPSTAVAVARQVGLMNGAGRVAVLERDDEVHEVLASTADVRIVARASPAQKLAVVKALRAAGELVAVTGDGVNDVPALREADIGIAMGERGTRAAREAAAIVLLDDNFRSIVDAIAEGQQLFLNLRLAFVYLLLVHLPLVLGAAIVPLFAQPLLYLPVHIVWLELVIHPTALLAFQDQPARHHLAAVETGPARFFSRGAWLAILVVGGFASMAVVLGYLHALGQEHDVAHARSLAITIQLLCGVAFTAALSRMRAAAGLWLAGGILASTILLVEVPTLGGRLHLSPLHLSDWAVALLLAAIAGLGARSIASHLQRRGARQSR